MSANRFYFWKDNKIVAADPMVNEFVEWVNLPCIDTRYAPSSSPHDELYTGRFTPNNRAESQALWEHIPPDDLPRPFLAALMLRNLYEPPTSAEKTSPHR